MQRSFTLDEARALLPDVRRTAGEIVAVRAELTELLADLQARGSSERGGVPEAKALEARLAELLDWFVAHGIDVKGWAPIVIDFWGEVDGGPALLCWLEGEAELGWWHRPEHGFAGRRPLPA